MTGRFITLEGIEGAGKSTLAAALASRLRRDGRAVLLTREPGGTPLAEKIRTAVLERGTESVTPEAETLMMFAARSIHLENRIRPALARGEWVLCDRFTDATRAYQGAGRGVSSNLIETLATVVQRGTQPELTLLLDLPAALGLQRSRARGTPADRIESEALEFFERVRARYLELAQGEPRRIVVLRADELEANALADAAWSALTSRLAP